TCCGSECADLQTDHAHCGDCSTVCATGRSCASAGCHGWATLAAPPSGFVAREKAAYVAVSGKVFIWGGADASGAALNTGALYDPKTDTWTLTAVNAKTPTGRVFANAVWTGTYVIVWGGRTPTGSADYKDGALYDPVGDQWSAMKAQTGSRSAS